MSIKVMRQALEALENSIDMVRHEYEADWRHGIPTRKAQLDVMKQALDEHEAAITALRQAIEQAETQRQWVGLTHSEYEEAVDGLEDLEDCWIAIEDKLRNKNT